MPAGGGGEGRYGAAIRPDGEGNCCPALPPPRAAGASRSRPELAAQPRRRPQPPADTDPPRTRFLRSRTPALASPGAEAGQCSPLLGRGDSRRDVNTARPAARAHPPPPGSVTPSHPAPRAPRGQARSAPSPFSKSRSRPLPGALGPLPPVPGRCHRHSLRKTPPQSREQTTQARGGGAEGGGGTQDGKALSPRPSRSLSPASAARALTCSPRRREDRGVPFPPSRAAD